jgi:Protein kinase domain
MNAATLRTAAASSSSSSRRRWVSGRQPCRSCRTIVESSSSSTTTTTTTLQSQQHRQYSTFRHFSISMVRTCRGGLPLRFSLGTSGALPRPGRHAAILGVTQQQQKQQRPYTRTSTAHQQFDAAHLASISNRRGRWGGGGDHGDHYAWWSGLEMWGWTTAAAAASAAVTYASLEAFCTPSPPTSLEAAAHDPNPDAAVTSQCENHQESTPMQSRPSVQATTSLFSPSFYDTSSPGGAPTATSTTSTVSVSSPPRNVMLHRMRSLKGRSLTAKYLVDWNTVLGEGAYGSVHPARLRATGEKVALKKISRHYTNASGFKTETDALLRIYDNGGHPNISGLRDMYEDHNCYYLILDLVTGGEMFEVRIETH